jgi:GGDEF domain-containing protein
MREQVVRRIDLGGIEVGVDVSIGIAHVAEGGDAAAVLGLADRAMYEAKRCKGDLLRAGAEVALASL